MKRIRSMKGLEIYETADGGERVGIVYGANKRTFREMVGDVTNDPSACNAVENIRPRKRLKGKYRDCPVCLEAVKRLDSRRADVKRAKQAKVPYLTPAEREEAIAREQEEIAKAAHASREPLLFEAAVERFKRARKASYSSPGAVDGYFRNLGKAFAGRHLDTITRAEVAQYYRDRRANEGPFSGRRRKGGLRPAQNDLVQFSALYTFLKEEEERETKNPCSAYKALIGKTKAETYVPLREPYLPSDEEVLAIFASSAREKMPRVASHMPGDPFRAFLKVCYYTGGRTESEPCALRHGDVTFSDPSVVSTSGRKAMGQVRFRRAKNARSNRDLPMHPDLEADLKAIMLPRPTDPAEVEEWEALPIFRQRDGKTAWTIASYRKGWAEIVRTLTGEFPGLRKMVVRDFRQLLDTRMLDAGVPEPLVDRWLGHRPSVSRRYYRVREWTFEEAANTLSLSVGRTSERTANAGNPTGAIVLSGRK